jgi:predicted RNase H-like HicB family nuclease
MQGLRFVYWQDGDAWLGYLEEYPDHLTQGNSLSELKEHLRDIWTDITAGHVPAVRRVGELDVA